jgi:probable rRNA maturation factor
MILNRQRRVHVSLRELEQFAARAHAALNLPADALTICLVTDLEIARWNRSYRGKNVPTDVLSFRSGDADSRPNNGSRGRSKAARAKKKSGSSASFFARGDTAYLGDIAIAPAVARRNARRFGRTFEDEMRILILHGMLHLMGYDHETDTGQMERRENRLRRALGLA